MRTFSRYALVVSGFFFSPFLFGEQPPDIGHFKGLAFSSSTLRHPIEIDGGHLVRCEATAHADIARCDVEKGSLVVTGSEWSNLDVKFTRVTVLRGSGKTPTRHYYYRGTSTLLIGGKSVPTAVAVTLNVEDAVRDRVRGVIDLPEQATRTSLEAYLVP